MRVAVNGINLNVREAGGGDKAFVFLHFWGGSSLEWSPVMAGLSQKFRCIAIDLRGGGLSDASASGYRIADLADDVQGVVSALKVKEYVVAGHSMGGKVAQVLAARRPHGLRGLGLVASAPASGMEIGQEQRDQMRGAYASRDTVSWALDNVLTVKALAAHDREIIITDTLRLSEAAREGWIEIGSREDYSAEIVNVNVPVVIVAGDGDKVDPPGVVNGKIVPMFKNPEVHFIENTGHLLPLEAPRELVSILEKFGARVFS